MHKYVVIHCGTKQYYKGNGEWGKINCAIKFDHIPNVYQGLKVLEIKLDGKLVAVE